MFKSESKYYWPLEIASWYILVPYARVIENVYLSTNTSGKHELHRVGGIQK